MKPETGHESDRSDQSALSDPSDSSHARTAELRRRAEALAGELAAAATAAPLSPEAMQRVLHELRVHQIELEMQNEELRRTQEALDASRERYFDLYDLAPVGYLTVGEKGVIMEANIAAATLLGVPRGALVNRGMFSQFIATEDLDSYYLHRNRLFATGQPQSWEARMVDITGTIFWAHLAATAATDSTKGIPQAKPELEQQPEQGAPGRRRVCRVVISDITERKLVEAEKERLESEKRQLRKAESLTCMAGAIAHNFNNLLQGVMMGLELAKGDVLRLESPDESLDLAMQSARKAARVSGMMLTYLGQTTGKRERLDLAEVCRQSLPLLRAELPTAFDPTGEPGAGRAAVLLAAELPSPGPAVVADSGQIQQILSSLLENAWESMGAAGGSVRLSVKSVEAAALPVTNRFPLDYRPKSGAYACIEVADIGCGISRQDMEKLFDPFFTRKFTGRGLGLSVVLGIVRAHGGAIAVESELGRGSVFRVYLPVAGKAVGRVAVAGGLAPVEGSGHVSEAAAAAALEHRGTVLVVEDDSVERKATALVLKRAGFGVLVAEDGVAGVEVFRQYAEQIGCVLCDVALPRLGGWETMEAVRKLSPEVPVILTSGYSEAQTRELAKVSAEPPEAFLRKPYGAAVLVEVVGQALARQQEQKKAW